MIKMQIITWYSWGCNFPSLAFAASEITSFDMDTNPFECALNTIGVINPESVLTATLISTALCLKIESMLLCCHSNSLLKTGKIIRQFLPCLHYVSLSFFLLRFGERV